MAPRVILKTPTVFSKNNEFQTFALAIHEEAEQLAERIKHPNGRPAKKTDAEIIEIIESNREAFAAIERKKGTPEANITAAIAEGKYATTPEAIAKERAFLNTNQDVGSDERYLARTIVVAKHVDGFFLYSGRVKRIIANLSKNTGLTTEARIIRALLLDELGKRKTFRGRTKYTLTKIRDIFNPRAHYGWKEHLKYAMIATMIVVGVAAIAVGTAFSLGALPAATAGVIAGAATIVKIGALAAGFKATILGVGATLTSGAVVGVTGLIANIKKCFKRNNPSVVAASGSTATHNPAFSNQASSTAQIQKTLGQTPEGSTRRERVQDMARGGSVASASSASTGPRSTRRSFDSTEHKEEGDLPGNVRPRTRSR